MGAEVGTHRAHSISQFLSVQMIFFSPLANIDFLSFVSLELYSPRLHLLSLCCCRSSITARKTGNNVGYLPAVFEPAEETQKHKRKQKEDALVVNPSLKPSSTAMPAGKLDSGQAAAGQRPLPNTAAGSITSVLCSLAHFHLIYPSLINSSWYGLSFQLLCHREIPCCSWLFKPDLDWRGLFSYYWYVCNEQPLQHTFRTNATGKP